MTLRSTLWTGLTSYGHLASIALTTFISVPLALRFLDREEFGLWSFASQIVGYLLLIDMGVSASIGRLMAEPLHRDDHEEISRWFTLTLGVLIAQAMLLMGVGFAVVPATVRWFHIPDPLQGDAANLLRLQIAATALAHPFRICNGILFAQNRAYLPNAIAVVTAWANLLAFAIFLVLGFRSLAYGFASLVMTTLQAVLAVWLVATGPHRFRLSRLRLFSAEMRDLFTFSSSLFVIGIAVQVVLMSQALVLTKFAGLAAVASFNVCTKAAQLLMQLLWRPFDSFAPRWQQLYVSAAHESLSIEFRQVTRLTLGATVFAVFCLACLNRWFVSYWAKPELYLGRSFDLLFGVYLLCQTVNHCLSYPFVLTKRTRMLAIVSLVEAPCNVAASIWAVQRWSVHGLMIGSIASTVAISMIWIAMFGPRQLGVRLTEIARDHRPVLPLFIGLTAAGTLLFYGKSSQPLWIEVGASLLASCLLAYCARSDLAWLVNYFRRRRASAAPVLEL